MNFHNYICLYFNQPIFLSGRSGKSWGTARVRFCTGQMPFLMPNRQCQALNAHVYAEKQRC